MRFEIDLSAGDWRSLAMIHFWLVALLRALQHLIIVERLSFLGLRRLLVAIENHLPDWFGLAPWVQGAPPASRLCQELLSPGCSSAVKRPVCLRARVRLHVGGKVAALKTVCRRVPIAKFFCDVDKFTPAINSDGPGHPSAAFICWFIPTLARQLTAAETMFSERDQFDSRYGWRPSSSVIGPKDSGIGLRDRGVVKKRSMGPGSFDWQIRVAVVLGLIVQGVEGRFTGRSHRHIAAKLR